MSPVPKIAPAKTPPRGARVRTPAPTEIETPDQAQKISPPIFLFLLLIAIMTDLLGIIPLIGGSIGAVFAFFLSAGYWTLGARSSAAMAAISLGLLIETVPLTAFLPANTAIAVLVYLLVNKRLPVISQLAS